MNHKVYATIQKYSMLQPGDAVVVAFSGGADSSALLEFFCQNRRKLGLTKVVAVHVNHLLRGEEAMRDEEFVRMRCASKGIPCIVERRDIRKLAEQSGESNRSIPFSTRHRNERVMRDSTSAWKYHSASDRLLQAGN